MTGCLTHRCLGKRLRVTLKCFCCAGGPGWACPLGLFSETIQTCVGLHSGGGGSGALLVDVVAELRALNLEGNPWQTWPHLGTTGWSCFRWDSRAVTDGRGVTDSRVVTLGSPSSSQCSCGLVWGLWVCLFPFSYARQSPEWTQAAAAVLGGSDGITLGGEG